MNNLIHSKKHLQPFSLFIFISFFIILLNCLELGLDTLKMAKQKQGIPFYFSGFKFLGLESIFSHVAFVGYYTDKDISHNKQAAANFGQAQYILAPTILDLNNLEHEFILFDCSKEEIAFQKIKEIKAIPLKKNPFGIILARRTK